MLRLCDSVGAPGAALVDPEGETVDYAGTIDPFDIRIAAAELRLILKEVSAVSIWSDTDEIILRGSKKSFALVAMEEGYAIVIQLLPHCFSVSYRAVSEAVREASSEAGLPLASRYVEGEHWTRVEVRPTPGDERRPHAIWYGGTWCVVEVLGRYHDADLDRGELGYRARLANGAEVGLVREQLGRWYAEELPQL